MATPYIHSENSVKRWGGSIKDYLPIHELMDDPKSTMSNNTGRAVTHNTWFIFKIIPMIFGYHITNTSGKQVSTIDIAIKHVLEDYRFKFLPTPQDYLKHMNLQPWMNNAATSSVNYPSELDKEVAEYFKNLKR